MPSRVILFGMGGVGRGVLEMILQLFAGNAELASEISVAGIADSKHILMGVGLDGAQSLLTRLSEEAIRAAVEAKGPGGKGLDHVASLHGLATADASRALTVIPELIERARASERATGSGQEKIIFVDCTAIKNGELFATVMDMGCGVVFANNKPLASSLDLFKRLTYDRKRVRLESSIGAGMPFHATIRRVQSSGDRITKISGHFSGCLSFIISGAGTSDHPAEENRTVRVEEGGLFSDQVREARRRGLTEPDPRDDLSGRDTARKALIVARWLGFELELSDLSMESLVPPSYESLPLDEFMERLPDLDEFVKARVVRAASNGANLIYFAVVEKGGARVGFKEVAADRAVGMSQGTNWVEIYSDVFNSDDPLYISGPGAGTRSTAAGVVSDIVELAEAMW